MRPGAFLKLSILWRSRRCRIKPSVQIRSALPVFAALFSLALVFSGCRQDMQDQPKFVPLRSNTFFPDQRSARDPVPGTVAQGQLDDDTYFLTGKHGNVLGNDLPDELSKEDLRKLLLRGQDRFNIYCTPCHARVGDGGGMIVQRGYKRPPSFHDPRLRDAPLGHFFDVMSNGFGAMPDYSAQIKIEDRWAIAAYIRALQLSQHVTDADLAQKDQNKLSAPPENKSQIPASSKAQQPQGGGKP
jgi:mono/diheme cytochrome c family protein